MSGVWVSYGARRALAIDPTVHETAFTASINTTHKVGDGDGDDVDVALPPITAANHGGLIVLAHVGASFNGLLSPDGTDTIHGVALADAYTLDTGTSVMLQADFSSTPHNWIAIGKFV